MENQKLIALNKLDINRSSKHSFAVHLKTGEFNSDWHSYDKHQLLYAEGGILHLTTRQHYFLLPANHAAWIPANCAYKISSNAAQLNLRMLYFNGHRKLDSRLNQVNIFPVNKLAQEMIYKTREWSNSFQEYTPLEQLFFQAFILLIPQWLDNSVTLAIPNTNHRKLSEILDHIKKNLDHEITVSDIAQKFSLSNRSITRLFKQEIGITFRTYLRISRIARAMDLLSDRGYNVSTAAYAVGYESISAFSTTFYNVIGVRPQEYVKRLSMN